jgi:dihydrofolate synthase/folylpolyglutamate synthase
MTYDETVHYLYTCMPAYEHLGPSAYKPGLDTSIALDNLLENPHRDYKTIHVAGTNGKGSVCHLLAAILQQSGYKVGLYTSPHLVDFRERIRVDGKMISKECNRFRKRYSSSFEPLKPSFFELTSTLAFDYFRAMKVDIAVIETGLGGRLDSTNIISPILSIITNISLDHIQFLGNTEEQIAFEKAGIIKEKTPIVIGEVYKDSVAQVFKDKAKQLHAPLFFAQDGGHVTSHTLLYNGNWLLTTSDYGEIHDELGGSVQFKNAATVLEAIKQLKQTGLKITDKAVHEGFEHVIEQTGLMGRWQLLQNEPHIICDTGHNIGGWQYLGKQLEEENRHFNAYIFGSRNDGR